MDEGTTIGDLISLGLYVVVGGAVVAFVLWRIIKMQKAGGALAAGLAAAAESQALGSRAGSLLGLVRAALDRHGGSGDAAASSSGR